MLVRNLGGEVPGGDLALPRLESSWGRLISLEVEFMEETLLQWRQGLRRKPCFGGAKSEVHGEGFTSLEAGFIEEALLRRIRSPIRTCGDEAFGCVAYRIPTLAYMSTLDRIKLC